MASPSTQVDYAAFEKKVKRMVYLDNLSPHITNPSGDATYRSGYSQEHPDLKKIKKILYLSCIRNTLNHKIRNTLKFKKKKKNYLFNFQAKKKKKL